MISPGGATGNDHVLVVTDDPQLRSEARFALAPRLEAALAGDAREALELMEADRPAVVVIDLRAGSAGGYALCKDMRQNPRLERVPVLMLLEREQDRWLAQQAGAELVRVKPIDGSDLLADTLSLLH
jgi:twitching motility two-component system response regulator PilH